MRTFEIKKGSVAIVGDKNGKEKRAVINNNMTFTMDDIIREPIRTNNSNIIQVVRELKFKFNKYNFEYIVFKYQDVNYID